MVHLTYLALKKARKPINWIGKTAIIAVGAVIGTVAGVVCVPIVLAVKSILVALEALACLLSPVFIGVLGATFVPCQVWCTGFFDKNVVGTANALAGGCVI